MQHSYHDTDHWASINLMPDLHLCSRTEIGPTGITGDTDHWLVTGVQVGRAHRGGGHAGRLLDRVIADADAEGITLSLMVVPDGTGLQSDQLIAFYSRRGFTIADEDFVTMTRPPQTERIAANA